MSATTTAQPRAQDVTPRRRNHLSVLNKQLPPTPSPINFAPSEMATVLIGENKESFSVHRGLLCSASPFFTEHLQDEIPDLTRQQPATLWLPGESAPMFALFVQWLHDQPSFRAHLDDTIRKASETDVSRNLQGLHWAMIRLHLFAAQLHLFHLQDLAIDAIQDLYLQRDWDVSPVLIDYLYIKCEASYSTRLRRWVVAMAAFRLAATCHNSEPNLLQGADANRFRSLFNNLPDFTTDYLRHLRNMTGSGLDIRFKNPQLRIAANRLISEERTFGFRQCSFHSHRASAGQGRCPHEAKDGEDRRVVSSIFDMSIASHSNTPPSRQQREAMAGLAPPRAMTSDVASENGSIWYGPGGSVPSTVNGW